MTSFHPYLLVTTLLVFSSCDDKKKGESSDAGDPAAESGVVSGEQPDSDDSPVGSSPVLSGIPGGSTGSTADMKLTMASCVDPNLDLLANTISLTMCNGTVGVGRLDLTNLMAANVKSGVTIAGVSGSYSGPTMPGACATDGEITCIASVGFPAANTTGLNNKLLAGQTAAGIAGTVTLPVAGKVLNGTSFGIGGTGLTGTLTLPLAADVLTGTAAYGNPGSAVTPAYSPDFPASSVVLTGNSVNSAAGTLTLPAVGDVFTGTTYGIGGTSSTGTLTLATAANVRSGQGAFGRSGTSVTPTLNNCTADGATGCVAVAGYPAALLGAGNLDVRNIRRGVTIGGITGAFPSATYPVPRFVDSGSTTGTQADGGITTGLTSFSSQLTTDGSFEFWDSNGVRRTGSGDSDILNANVKSGIGFENVGVSGTAVIPNIWDVRAGRSVGLDTGKLKANCRNGVKSNIFDITTPKSATLNATTDILTVGNHGFVSDQTVRISYSTVPTGLLLTTTYYVIPVNANSFQLSASAGPGAFVNFTAVGTNVTVFGWNDGAMGFSDTIDDFSNNNVGGVQTSANQPWGNTANWCGGLEATADDDNTWKDVTTAGSCAIDIPNCRMQDKISGVQWAKTQLSGTTRNWGMANEHCNSLTLDGYNDWRLPTQKELQAAYHHGIWTVSDPNWITAAQMSGTNQFWSATTLSSNAANAFAVIMMNGVSGAAVAKTTSYLVTCVR